MGSFSEGHKVTRELGCKQMASGTKCKLQADHTGPVALEGARQDKPEEL